MARPRFTQTDTAAPPPRKPPQAPPIIDASNPTYVPQPQYEPANVTNPIPEYTVTQTVTPESPHKRRPLGPENAQRIENWLNNLKPKFYDYLADKKFEAATSNVRLVEHLYTYLTLYKGEIIGEYLSEGAMEMIFSALGPIGNLWRSGHNKNISWKMAWMMNPLNPDSIYYYLKSLPERKAFEIALLPVEKAIAIIAHNGGPFTLATYQDHHGNTSSKYIFTPLLRATQAAHIAADGIDKLAGFSTNTFDPTDYRDRQSWNEDNSPWKQDMNKTNKNFHEALENLKAAKLTRDKTAIKTADQKLKFLLDEYDGWYHVDSSLSTPRKTVYAGAGLSRALLKNLYSNTARRLRSTERDPISYFLSLFGGAIWDLTLGIILNTAKTIATQVINLIPGVRVLRAQFTEFITGNKFLSNASIGGSSLRSVVQGVFTPATASFGYTGYRALSALFPNASIGQIYNPFTNSIINLAIPLNPAGIMGSAVIGSAGIFYNVALRMAASTNYYWTSQYQSYLKASTFKGGWAIDEGAMGNKLIPENYYKGFKPGPISNFAKFLAEHPFARIPINGFAVGDLLSPLMQAQFGWNPWTTRGVFAGADYLWQIKGSLFREIFGTKMWQFGSKIKVFGITTNISNPFYKLFGKEVINPFWKTFNLNSPTSITSWAYERYLGTFYTDPWNFREAALTERPWFKGFNKFISPARPFFQNFFNPGFFMGFGLIPLLTPIVGAWAYIIGPIVGSLTWNVAAFTLEKVFGTSIASMSRINAAGWTGYLVGSLLQLIFPALPAGFNIITAIAFPVIDMALIASGTSFVQLLAGGLSWIGTAIPALAGLTGAAAASLAAWATAISIAAVAGLTVFFAYTIYAGFWVPLIEEGNAQPTSPNFSISTKCALTAPNQYNCCSNFSLTENVLNSINYLEHKTDISNTYLSIDLTDPDKTTDAWRKNQQLNYDQTPIANNSLNSYANNSLDSNEYTHDRAQPIRRGYASGYPFMLTYLSSPTDQPQNLFELMQTNSSVVFSMQSFFDILTQLAEEYGKTQHLIDEYNAQLDLMKEQKKLVEDLIPLIENNKLLEASASATGYLNHNPMGNDPCPDSATTPCPEEKQGLKQLFDSWATTVNNYISTINIYLSQTGPDLQPFLDQLEQELKGLEQQIDLLPDIIDQMEEIHDQIQSQADADAILNANFLSFANMTLTEQNHIWDDLLAKYFPKVFDKSHTFFFIPQGTNYQVCVDTTYTGPTPATPQTVCSTISYTPSVWSPNTAFAKACTTFTPQ